MKKTALIAAALLCPQLLHADFKLTSVTASDVKDIIQTVPAGPKTPSQRESKDWTIMVFMNGKSNIEPFALNDINRFETVGSGEKINIVVELGRSKGLENDTTTDGDWAGVRRYLITRDTDKEHITSPVLMDLGNPDMGDYKEAVSFVKWAKTNYPAKHYMLIIWDHGWGWIDPKKPGENLLDENKSISHDFVSGNYIKTTDLGKIFKEAGRVNLYASMACFMQMAEVAYELKDGADIIVGAEEVVQLPSFNFEDFFTLMLANPEVSAAQAGTYLVDTFKEMYSRPEYADLLEKGKYGTQLSAVRADKLAAFAQKTGNWSTLAIKVNDAAAYRKAKTEVVRFEVGDEVTDPDKQISFYADLAHFVELVNANLDAARPGADELKAAGTDLSEYISGQLVVKNVHLGRDRTGKDYSNTHGIAIHLPGKPGNLIEYYSTYSRLAFEKVSNWSRFITYLEKIN
ncbi:MAG: clostripain-related cysteine peptidase [Elusimicrobiota bacterium]